MLGLNSPRDGEATIRRDRRPGSSVYRKAMSPLASGLRKQEMARRWPSFAGLTRDPGERAAQSAEAFEGDFVDWFAAALASGRWRIAFAVAAVAPG